MDNIGNQASVDVEAFDGGVVKEMHRPASTVFEAEFDWLFKIIEQRLNNYFHDKPFITPVPPSPGDSENVYHRFIREFNLGGDERIVLLLAMAPHVRPQLLDVFFTQNKELSRGFTEFGGLQGKSHSGFLPTVETAIFVLAGHSLERRISIMGLFDPDHVFFKFHMLHLHDVETDEPFTARRLDVCEDFLNQSLYSRPLDPLFGPGFPARKLESRLTWDDLVLDPFTREQLDELIAWLSFGDTLLTDWDLGRKLMPGYRCLFHGPPGTGKSLTAALLSQISKRRVYRIDLSMVISKYIGDTEKNLEKVFTQAEERDWILFFDEADALFGKRTQVSDSHDRFANQETSYLLQRVEVFPGVVILSSNLRSNIDEAFSRRFQSIIHFPMPDKNLRKQLWAGSFSPRSTLAADIDLDEIAAKYELSGGAIMNVIRFCSLMAMKRDSIEISRTDLEQGIYREFSKEGRSPD